MCKAKQAHLRGERGLYPLFNEVKWVGLCSFIQWIVVKRSHYVRLPKLNRPWAGQAPGLQRIGFLGKALRATAHQVCEGRKAGAESHILSQYNVLGLRKLHSHLAVSPRPRLPTWLAAKGWPQWRYGKWK